MTRALTANASITMSAMLKAAQSLWLMMRAVATRK